jgi:N-acetylglucosaminyldiphosphoundecaprenol N-acetyl-beta-D-mannosaminyltransferase
MENKSFTVNGMRVDVVQIPDVVGSMRDWIEKRMSCNYIVVSNANDVVLSAKAPKVKEAVNNSSLSVPDGMSLVVFARLLGYRVKRRVYGPELMLSFLELAQDKGYSNFFYGSTPSTLDLMTKNLLARFPRLKISGSYSPPFRELSPEEERAVTERINEVSPDILWVGLGCPKQQLWMHEHKNKLKVPVVAGVGAAFDFIAGTKSQAPRWMRETGFEWFFRLISEPRRLWRRYLINNTLFLYYVSQDLFCKTLATFRRPKSP